MAERSLARAGKKLGATIKARRLALGMTQEDAASAIGIDGRHFQKLESGSVNVTLRTLLRVCAGLRVELRDLFS